MTPADNLLPPDNFQEDPAPELAHRTSPTNIGLYLLSAAAAHDFGWAGLADTVERLEGTLATMARLERFRGHFYNWYDTTDLCGRWTRPTCPPWTAATWPGTSSRWRMLAGGGGGARPAMRRGAEVWPTRRLLPGRS